MAGTGLDLQALLEARLRGRAVRRALGTARPAARGARPSARRMHLVGRVTAEPGGALVDVLAVSAEADPDVLELAALPRPPRGAVEVVSSSVSAPDRGPRPRPGLRRRRAPGRVAGERGHPLPPGGRRPRRASTIAPSTVRRSCARRRGCVVVADREAAFWVSTNLAEGAVLFTIDGGRLQETQRADALPWPGSPQGARFHPGTNTIEVSVPGLGSGPHLRAGTGAAGWAIAPDGRLGVARAGWTATRVGSAAAVLWPGAWIASSAKPPGVHRRAARPERGRQRPHGLRHLPRGGQRHRHRRPRARRPRLRRRRPPPKPGSTA